ncbi:hypothetical protein Tco_0732894 [Tanacetum coccineum]
MSGSEPGEMAPVGSKVVVLPKFDMHIYTSELTSSELKKVVDEYCIPLDLHPRLPHPDMMMNRLLSRSDFEFKWLEEKVFLIDRRAIPDAMPWRHGDTDLHDDFPTNYNANDAATHTLPLSDLPLFAFSLSFDIPRCVSLRTLCFFNFILGMSGSEPGEMAPVGSKAVVLPKFDMHIYTSELTSLELKKVVDEYCIPLNLHPRLPHPDMTMNHLPSSFGAPLTASSTLVVRVRIDHDLSTSGVTTGTIVSRGGPIPDNQRPKPRVTPPLEAGAKIPDLTAFQKNLEKPNPKIVAARERKERQSLAKAEARRDDAEANEGPKKKRKVQKHHVSVQSGSEGTLSATSVHQVEPTLVKKSTPPADAAMVGPHVEKEVVDLSGNTCVPTPEATTQPSAHTKPPVTQKPAASEDSAHSECPSQEKELLERLKDLERERDEWRDEADRQNIVLEFIPVVVKRLHTSVEYRQSLAAPVSLCFTARWLGGLSLGRSEDEISQILSESKDLDIEGSRSWEAKHRELFTKSYPYVQKVADSYDLPMDELLKVSPDVPSTTDKGNTSGVGTGEASQQLPPSAL